MVGQSGGATRSIAQCLDQIAYKDLFRADARMPIEEHGTAFQEVPAQSAVAALTDARYGRISLALGTRRNQILKNSEWL